MKLLRGEKVKFYLIEGEVKLVDGAKYPFDKSKIPVQCKIINEKTEINRGFTSGNRSIVFKLGNEWFKAKAIGIPSGISQPIYLDKCLMTYYLYRAFIGSGRLIWGFMTIDEAEQELSWMMRARELKLPATKPIGIGIYHNVKIIKFPNRHRLFVFLRKMSSKDLIKIFKESGEKSDAACFFCEEPSDIRVDEILYGLLFPKIEYIIELNDCKDYLRWLGSSCAYNLRLHHDNNIIHGTTFVEGGVMTNSHFANHIISYDKTWMTDYHMTTEARGRHGKRLKIEEYYCLWHVMNPLPAAEAMARARRRRISLLELPQVQFETQPYYRFYFWEDLMKIYAGMYSPANVYEELTEALIEGIEYGYNRRKVLEIEKKLKREMLVKLIVLKHALWELYGLPLGMQRGIGVVREVMRLKKLGEDEVKKKVSEVQDKFEELL